MSEATGQIESGSDRADPPRRARFGRASVMIVLVACVALAVPLVVTLAASPSAGAPAAAPPSAATASAGAREPEDSDGDTKSGKQGNAFGKLFKGFGKQDDGSGNDGGRGRITITAISGSSVSLMTDDGWVRAIKITPQTTITKGGATITASGLKVGDVVQFHQVRATDGTYSIDRILVPTPRTGGEVTAVAAGNLTIKVRGGATKTIVLTSTTGFVIGQKPGSKADVKVGSRVEIEGSVDGDTFTAITVHVALAHVDGTVTKKTTTEITVAHRDGTTTTIHVSVATAYSAKGAAAASLANVVVGDRVSAEGTLRADDSLDAVTVQARPAGDKKDTKPKAPAASPAP